MKPIPGFARFADSVYRVESDMFGNSEALVYFYDAVLGWDAVGAIRNRLNLYYGSV